MEEFKMKRKIALLLACVMMTSVFAACGNKDGEENGEVPTLTWFLPLSVPSDEKLVEAEINKYLEPKLGAKLDLVFVDAGAYNEKMNMLMASQTEFDLAFSGWVNKFDRGVSQKGFLCLDEYLEKYPELKAAAPDYAWEAVKASDGKIYAFPNQQTYARTPATFITKKYVDKYNFDISKVKTIRDLEPLMEKIRDNEPDVYFWNPKVTEITPMLNETTTVMPGVFGFVTKRDDPECKVFYLYETPEYRAGTELVREYYNRGFIRKDAASAAGTQTSSKETAITQGSWKPGHEADSIATKRGEVVSIRWAEPCVTTELIRQTLTAISTTSKHPDKAAQLLALVNTDKELFRLMVHGIEGKHYEVLESGHIRVLDSQGYGSMHTAGWYLGNQFNSYVTEGKDLDIWDQMREFNESAIKSTTLGFNFDSTPVTNEISNISTVNSEYSGLGNGSLDPAAKYDEALPRLKEAGADKIKAEMQRQLDEWLANK